MEPEYFEAQRAFLQSLSEDEKYILSSYKEAGYVFLTQINMVSPTDNDMNAAMTAVEYLRTHDLSYGNFFRTKLEDITRDNVLDAIQQYAYDIGDIFKKAPILKTRATVYRGLRERFDPKKLGIVMSTTYSTAWGGFGVFTGKDCCLLEITVEPGIPTIWISGLKASGSQQEIIMLPYTFQMECATEPDRKQRVGDKEVSVFKCTVMPRKSGGKRVKMSRRRVNGRQRKSRSRSFLKNSLDRKTRRVFRVHR